MNISIKEINNGIQKIHRLKFIADNKETVFVDLWADECKELKEVIEQHFAGDDQ